IKWYVPILNRLPRDHRFNLGDRIISGLYDSLETLVVARYAQEFGRVGKDNTLTTELTNWIFAHPTVTYPVSPSPSSF
ncbi:MAG: hypothetical protein WA919_20075, partial [Coleofasciculaceae cyanobacterium]